MVAHPANVHPVHMVASITPEVELERELLGDRRLRAGLDGQAVVYLKAFATDPQQQAAVARAANELVAEQQTRMRAEGEVLTSDDGLRVVLQWHGHGSRRDLIERDADVIREALAAHPIFADARPVEAHILRTQGTRRQRVMPKRVLIVDDDPRFRALARTLLQASGYAVVAEAADGTQALAAARRVCPDAALVDMQLPDTDGVVLARRLAESDGGLRIVLTSTDPTLVSPAASPRVEPWRLCPRTSSPSPNLRRGSAPDRELGATSPPLRRPGSGEVDRVGSGAFAVERRRATILENSTPDLQAPPFHRHVTAVMSSHAHSAPTHNRT